MSDKSQNTEKPTLRRLKKAREEGNFPSARLFVNAMQFVTFVVLLHAWGPVWLSGLQTSMRSLFAQALDSRMAQARILKLALDLLWATLLPLSALGGGLLMVTIVLQLGVSRLGLSLKKLTPDLARLNSFSRIKELPKQNFSAMAQAMVMIPVFGAVVYYLVKDNFLEYLSLPLKSLSAGTSQVGGSIESLLWKAASLFVVFGLVDLARQQQRYTKSLKMSKQEIRDESKDMEGNPQMKARIRRLRHDQARRVMMHEVATATAIIVNPTHYAVAIRYDMGTSGAPRVVAKGKNFLAKRIRERALANQVPLIENPPLARALYAHADVGQEIPANFYRAVAEILAYIFRLTNNRPNA